MTNELRKLIYSKLKTVLDNVYYVQADDGAVFPHLVYSFDQMSMGDDVARHNYNLIVDVWYKKKPADAESTADDIEALFNAENLPQTDILPTFYLDRRGWVLDEDKTINHIQLKFSIQNYER